MVKPIFYGLLAAALGVTAAMAEDTKPKPEDCNLGPVGIMVTGCGNASFVNPGAVFPVSAAGPLVDEDRIVAGGVTNDMKTVELAGYSIGRALSEQTPDYDIGQFCTDYGGRSADKVDWQKTLTWIRTNDLVRAGSLAIVDSDKTGPDRRILFTAGGAVSIMWHYLDGTAETRAYNIASLTSKRPYRLYATRVDEPNDAAYVSLAGKFVNFFGPSNLLESVCTNIVRVDAETVQSNVLRRFDFDASGSKRLTYRYTVDKDKDGRESISCPQGQFVLAYYDTESKENMIATIVVEIVLPAVHTVDATVGSELRPSGGGFDIEGLVATVAAGHTTSPDDPYAPYVEQFQAPVGQELGNRWHGRVYAIAPTDASTSDRDMPMPWKVDIYWRAPDPMGTLWTFENDWYNITWPKDVLRTVVSGDASAPGTCMLVPTNYSAQVMNFREPVSLAVGSTAWGEVIADREGRFLVRLEDAANPVRPWFIPVETCLREGGARTGFVSSPEVFDWPVGKELTLVTGEPAGANVAEQASRMSSSLPAYIYEPGSTGRNWNPRLYHFRSPAEEAAFREQVNAEALAKANGGDETDDGGSGTDPYAALDSTVYGVNASDKPIELWWYGMFFDEGMTVPVTYPGLIERYRLYWDESPGLYPEIALSSQLGSAGRMTACDGRSLAFTSDRGTASVYADGLRIDSGSNLAWCVGLRLMPLREGSVETARPTAAGRLLTVSDTNGSERVDFSLQLAELAGDKVRVAAVRTVRTGRKAVTNVTDSCDLVRGTWSSVTVELPLELRDRDLDFTLGAFGDAPAATGVAIDDVAFWGGEDTSRPTDGGDYTFNFDFDTDDLETFGPTGVRVAIDAQGAMMAVEGGQALEFGSPRAVDGTLASENGVVPELYWQNDPTEPGYNPNEEHAFIRPSANDPDRSVVWALRNDLNLKSDPNATPPYVLAMYPRSGRGEMRMFRVVARNADYPEFVCEAIVGRKIAPPAPLGLLEGCNNEKNSVVGEFADLELPLLTDHNLEMWAKNEGEAQAFYSYPMQEGFHCPSLGDKQIPTGTLVSWMSCADMSGIEPAAEPVAEYALDFAERNGGGVLLGAPLLLGEKDTGRPYWNTNSLPDEVKISGGKAMPWTWKTTWPSNTVPSLKVGQILVKPTEGLPEMYNALSMTIAFPSQTNAPASLIDPTCVRYGGELTIKNNFPTEYGFTVGPSGNCQLRKGKYYFTGLPPSVSDRFYVDTNAVATNRLCLVGEWVERPSGGSCLRLNVLTEEERKAITGLVASSHPKYNAWKNAVANFPRECKTPYERFETLDRHGPEQSETQTIWLPPDAVKPFETFIGAITNQNRGWIGSGDIKSNCVDFVVKDYTFIDASGQEKKCTITTSEKMDHNKAVVSLPSDWATQKSAVICTEEKLAPYKLNYEEWVGRLQWVVTNENKKAKSEMQALPPWPKLKTKELTLTRADLTFKWYGNAWTIKNKYGPHDHLALRVHGGGDSHWLVLVENDDPDTSRVPEGTPVQMHVMRVEPKLHVDGIEVLTDQQNKLSERLTIQYRTPFCDDGENGADGPSNENAFVFQWKRRQPNEDGTINTTNISGDTTWQDVTNAAAVLSLQLGGANSKAEDFVNTYYTMRYRPVAHTLVYKRLASALGKGIDGDADIWSDWCTPQLAEGWLQRTLNTVTPFAQRVDDFYTKESDIKYTMFEQIGGPYQGDVALNNDNLANVGLLELYRTLFNRMESVLISSEDPNFNSLTRVNLSKQLLLAATRIAQFYAFLGADAYADAKNPLISQGRDQFWEQEVPAADYSFANQVPSLLDEELALLRGLTSATAYPNKREAPCYNRLRWNLTRGLTEGEVAYVNNYGIQSDKGALDVNCAANQYPQGHGDAWGHYLSVLSTYYRLIRNPSFDWTAAMGEMLMDQTVMNVDYQDEEKFADAVLKLVQTGIDAMDLTVRKAYKERGGKSEEGRGLNAGYFDADAEQAFGYGEWAARTGMNAIYGWMAGNALLPDAEAAQKAYKAFADRGIMKIDRSAAPQLEAVCTLMANLDRKLNDYEAGLNPLGLSENAVPFDIDPDELAAKNTHFEQILARAEKALGNCRTVLDYANVYGSQLARIQNAEADAATEKETREQEFKQQLIAIYGTPYPSDCGINGTYEQGYDGPDIYNYNYMDFAEFGITNQYLNTIFTNSFEYYNYKFNIVAKNPHWASDPVYTQKYYVNADGIRIKPSNITGKRATEGSIQAAYREYLTAYNSLNGAMAVYKDKVYKYESVYNTQNTKIAKFSLQKLMDAFLMVSKSPTRDTQKMIGAILAQPFSSVNISLDTPYGKFQLNTSDLGQYNRYLVFDKFYKDYLNAPSAQQNDQEEAKKLKGILDRAKALENEARRKYEQAMVVYSNALSERANPAYIEGKYDGSIRPVIKGEGMEDPLYRAELNEYRIVHGQEADVDRFGFCWIAQIGYNKAAGDFVSVNPDEDKDNPAAGYAQRVARMKTISAVLKAYAEIVMRYCDKLCQDNKGNDKPVTFPGINNQNLNKQIKDDLPAGISTAVQANMFARDVTDKFALVWEAYSDNLRKACDYLFWNLEDGAPAAKLAGLLHKAEEQYLSYVRASENRRQAEEAYYNETTGGIFKDDKNQDPESDIGNGLGTNWIKLGERIQRYFKNVWTDPHNFLEFLNWLINTTFDTVETYRNAVLELRSAAEAVTTQGIDVRNKTAVLAGCEAAYRAELYKGQELLEARELWRRQFSNNAVQYRYLDMFDRVQRSTALTKYSTAFDTAQRYVWELAKVYDYETGLLSSDRQAGDRFLAEIIGTRSLGREGVSVSSGTTDGGLYDIVNRLKSNWDVLKPRLGMNNADKPEKWFSLRWEKYRLGRDKVGDEKWSAILKGDNYEDDKSIYCDNILKNPDFVRYCQPLANAAANAGKSEPGYIIYFKTSIYNAQNFFGRPLFGGDNQFSAADYATKIDAVGVYFENYDKAVVSETNKVGSVALAKEPNVYLVPIGDDVMRSPAGTERKELCWKVVDQVLPLPYTIGSTELDSAGWISSMVGFDGTSDSGAVIRRHSTLRAGYNFNSTRLVGRSAWNTRWMLVIPASSLNSNFEEALKTFRETVTDIKIGIRAYSRQGN